MSPSCGFRQDLTTCCMGQWTRLGDHIWSHRADFRFSLGIWALQRTSRFTKFLPNKEGQASASATVKGKRIYVASRLHTVICDGGLQPSVASHEASVRPARGPRKVPVGPFFHENASCKWLSIGGSCSLKLRPGLITSQVRTSVDKGSKALSRKGLRGTYPRRYPLL